MSSEKNSLIGSTSSTKYYSTGGKALGPNEVIVSESAADEMPSPFTLTGGAPSIKCRVCNAIIPLFGKNDQNIIKCTLCTEATPIRPAPMGKKYVRCRCNCLLIAKAGSTRVACPRENCNLIIVLETPSSHSNLPPGYARVSCAHCFQQFLFHLSGKFLARCPHCRKISSVSSGFVKRRFLVSLIVGSILLLVGILVTCLTHEIALENHGLFALYVFLFLIAIFFLIRACYYKRMQLSRIEAGPF